MATPKAGYRTADGAKVPSVTTILGRFKDSGGLIQWAYKQGRLHENLSMRNLPAPAHLYDVSGAAALSGTIAHDLIEQHILLGYSLEQRVGLTPAITREAPEDVIARAWNAYEQFIKWYAQTSLKVIATERGLVSERYRFGGTLDAVGQDADGKVVLIDWKTSNKVYGDYLIQLAAYSLLLEENIPEWSPTGYHLLRVAKESADFAHHYYGDLTVEKEAFIAMVGLYDKVDAIQKRA